MKKCTYCGKEYPDDASVCVIDQMKLASDKPKPSADSENSFGLSDSMRAFMIMVVFLGYFYWSWLSKGNGGPSYGSVPIYPGTPHCSIYLGLEADQEQAMYDAINRFGETNGIQRCKPYHVYSGPPLASYTGDSIAIFVRSGLTKDCAAMHERRFIAGRVSDYYHWPTNGSRIIYNGHSVQMPFTGIISVSVFGTNYSTQEFRRVSDGLVGALRLAFTNRSVDLFMTDTNKP